MKLWIFQFSVAKLISSNGSDKYPCTSTGRAPDSDLLKKPLARTTGEGRRARNFNYDPVHFFNYRICRNDKPLISYD